MVNIVVVSHSRKLAEGVVELASQMAQGRVKFAVAAGIEDAENPIGTDPVAVMTAIQDVFDDAGVLVMVDMGSALLSADMALDLLGATAAARVEVCAAPLVEGTVAAAVAAASGQDIGRVMDEAHQALCAKYVYLGQQNRLAGAPAAACERAPDAFPLAYSWTVANPNGIHARPAAAIAACLNRFDAEARLVKGAQSVNAKSVSGIALLAARGGETIVLKTRGPQAQEAIDAFAALAAARFGDEAQQSAGADTPRGAAAQANARLSVTARRVERGMPEISARAFTGVEAETAMLDAALADAKRELDEVIALAEAQLSPKEAAIFAAHRMMLEDVEPYDAARDLMARRRAPAEIAWREVIAQMAQECRAIDDVYLRERFIDIYDVGFRVLRLLPGATRFTVPENSGPTVIVANFLLPSEVMALDSAWIKGLYFSEIGLASHAALLAVARGIPVYIDDAGRAGALRDGAAVTIDAASGDVITAG
ncbi:dihydroxyacetone kinase phosphoryl donor subunit DhaM [Brenneria populi subsp. brevivirga]|uniref:dihydroxyacetone kinase phosphoryl donor subunit DhaM n=1 Tax=Brenneria populi TaxID=1505588 RepID=UPI002E1766B9|nr:dihydroxyacetone kinase phosphoryl donor subunit DhaM [Brenneria populi subsp. brevivirga]